MDNLVSNTRQEAHLNLYRTKREFYNEHTGQKLSKLIEKDKLVFNIKYLYSM
jgi:hypothetical protein